jgi:hypothetical protein
MSYRRTVQTKNAKQEPEYEVDAILDAKVENVCLVIPPLGSATNSLFAVYQNNVEYLVKWTEYGPEDNSWVLASDTEYVNLFATCPRPSDQRLILDAGTPQASSRPTLRNRP